MIFRVTLDIIMEVLNKAKIWHKEATECFMDFIRLPVLAFVCTDYYLEPLDMLFERCLLQHIWEKHIIHYYAIWTELVEMAKSNRQVASYLTKLHITGREIKVDQLSEAVTMGRPLSCHRVDCYYGGDRTCTCGRPIRPSL